MVRARPAGNPMSSMTFFQVALGVLGFDVGGDDFDAGLIGGVHRGSGEIVGVAVEDEAERFFRVEGPRSSST